MSCKDRGIRKGQNSNRVSYTHTKWSLLHMKVTFIHIAPIFINTIVTFKEVINQWSWLKKRGSICYLQNVIETVNSVIYNIVKMWKDILVIITFDWLGISH